MIQCRNNPKGGQAIFSPLPEMGMSRVRFLTPLLNFFSKEISFFMAIYPDLFAMLEKPRYKKKPMNKYQPFSKKRIPF